MNLQRLQAAQYALYMVWTQRPSFCPSALEKYHALRSAVHRYGVGP